MRPVGDINVSRFCAGAHQLRRTPKSIASSSRESVLFVLPTKGCFSYEHMGREGLVRTNDALLMCTFEPYKTQCSDPYENICFEVELPKLEPRIASIHDACGRTITLDADSQWFFKQTLAAMLDNDSADAGSHGTISTQLSSYIISLAVTNIGLQFLRGQDMQSRSYKDGLRQRIAIHIMNNLCDPELSPKTIAAAHGISPSYLHKLFNDSGTSVNRMIIEKRLAISMERLRNPAFNSMTVTEIAYQAGFANSAHFSTRFRKRYGFPPRDARYQQ